jgi:hypothetical protein
MTTPLDYETPQPPPPGNRATTATTRFAGGVGLAFLVSCAISALHGDIDIPIGPACGSVIIVGMSGLAFAAVGAARVRPSKPPLKERNRLLTFLIGVACPVLLLPLFALVPEHGIGPSIAILTYFAACGACNWIALA